MADIATLGLAIDSSQAVSAAAALNGLTTAATGASGGMIALQNSASNAAGGQGLANAAANVHSESLRGQRLVLRGLMADFALFSPQLGQVGMIAAALYIENSHLVEGFGGLRSALASILTPTNLMIGGFAALAVGSYLAWSSIKTTELAFSELGERTDTTVQKLHALEAAAAFKGIDTAAFLKDMTQFGVLTDQATFKMGSLAELFRLNNVQSGTMTQNMFTLADLVKNATSEQQKYVLLQEAGLTPTREMVQYFNQGGAALRQMTDNAKAFGPEVDVMIAKSRALDEQWRTLSKTLSDGFKSGFLDTIDWFSRTGDMISGIMVKLGVDVGKAMLKQGTAGFGSQLTQSDANQFYDKTGAGASSGASAAAAKAKTLEQTKFQIGLEQQRIGILGNMVTVEDTVRQKENEIYLARVAGVTITDKEKDSILAYTAATALGVTAIRQSTSAQQIQGAVVGMSVGNAAAYQAVQEKINEALIKGQPLDAAKIASLQTYADALGKATQATALLKAASDQAFATSQLGRSDTEAAVATQLRTLYGDDFLLHMNDAIAGQVRFNSALTITRDLGQQALSGFLQDIRNGTGYAVAFTNALTKIENKLFDIISNQAMSALVKSSGGLFSGMFGGAGTAPAVGVYGLNGSIATPTFHTGGIVGTDAVAGRYVHPAYFDHAPRFHSGGIVSGEVPVIAKAGEGVFTKAQMASLQPAGGGGGGNSQQVIVNNYSGEPVQTNKRSDNGVDIVEVMIGQVQKRMADGGFDGVMRGRFGASIKPQGR